MQRLYRVQVTIEGRPFHVRRDRIAAAGSSPVYSDDQMEDVHDPATRQVIGRKPRDDAEPTPRTHIFVDGLGYLAIDETLDEFLTVWDV